MTGQFSLLQDYQPINGEFVAFVGNPRGRKIEGQGTVSNGVNIIERVNFVSQLKYNLMSVSQIYDKYLCALLNSRECLILKHGVFIPKDLILMHAPRRFNTYSLDLNNPSGIESCFLSKALEDESFLWHRRLGHHKSSHKPKTINSIDCPFQLLHKDLFGPVSVMSHGRKSYCLVVTDDFSRFTWVFFLAKKDETPKTMKIHLLQIKNLFNLRVKTIRSDHVTEFKNIILDSFCESKGISRQFSAPRTL
ncbi:hypothetical protein L1987_45881 [Smallanthus sonchifolius]|uniref:Uncharacterized protein n=1 Tax=Smallanthus sonchifolius TaxID=185202 RepID=A0ACB9FZ79_9ASTR|nr:hypothetical protein L1987_45881 [Smallanthus sonchifolius]